MEEEVMIVNNETTSGNETLENIMATSLFPVGGKNVNYAQYFDGTSYLNMLSMEQVIIVNVTF